MGGNILKTFYIFIRGIISKTLFIFIRSNILKTLYIFIRSTILKTWYIFGRYFEDDPGWLDGVQRWGKIPSYTL